MLMYCWVRELGQWSHQQVDDTQLNLTIPLDPSGSVEICLTKLTNAQCVIAGYIA